MSSSSALRATQLAARLSLRDYFSVYPPTIYLFSTAPRVILQAAFFALVGQYVGGEAGKTYAFVGACVHVALISTVIRGPDILVDERVMGTFYRLRLGVVPLPAIVLARWWVFVAEGVANSVLAILVVGLLIGEAGLTGRLLLTLPLILLTAVTTSALGMFIGAVSLLQRADVLITNLASYVLLVVAGVVAPVERLGSFSGLGNVVPLTHGLAAIRAAESGQPWWWLALAEAAVGVSWLVAAFVVFRMQQSRARRTGSDELY